MNPEHIKGLVRRCDDEIATLERRLAAVKKPSSRKSLYIGLRLGWMDVRRQILDMALGQVVTQEMMDRLYFNLVAGSNACYTCADRMGGGEIPLSPRRDVRGRVQNVTLEKAQGDVLRDMAAYLIQKGLCTITVQ